MDMCSQQVRPIKIWHALVYYAGAWCALSLAWMVAGLVERLAGHDLAALLVFAVGYLGVGAMLNRRLLPRLIDGHSMYDIVQNVASAKVRMIVFWPFSYLFLLMRPGVARHL